MRSRPAFTLVEMLIAVAIGTVVLATAVEFLRVGNKSVATTSDHAIARMEAMKIHEAIREDLDRLVVDDDLMHLAVPVTLKDKGAKLEFYALHHREVSKSKGELTLVGRPIVWTSEPAPGGGRTVLRNGKRFAGTGLGAIGPVTDLKFAPLDRKQACELQISPYHALWVKVYPRGAWDRRNQRLASEANVQARLIHMSHIESQYACMLTIKKAGPPAGVFTNLDQLDDPFQTFDCPDKAAPPSIPLDWVRPLGLVRYDKSAPFDDKDADEDVELP